MDRKIIVSGVGCCLVDRLYNHLPFGSEVFAPFLTRTEGDGGLSPGRLVFKEEFDRFAGVDFLRLLPRLTGGQQAETMNVGGPCIVALIHAAQLSGDAAACRFYGCHGNDDDGRFLLSALRKTPVDLAAYRLEKGDVTASTIVLSDPDYDGGNGERVFINTIGASWKYRPDEPDDAFFASDVVVFGGTALVPQIHDSLTALLVAAKAKGCFTVVNTVFDFRNEKAHPDRKWPLGESDDSYRHIDLLITDCEEALRLSGKRSTAEALAFFRSNGAGAGAIVITNGARDVSLYASGKRFTATSTTLPVSEAVAEELKKGSRGDTTGCGDNFAGGVIASVIAQLRQERRLLDLTEACRWGIVSGGFTCFYMGGTWFEKYPGEKRELIAPYYEKYLKQTTHAE
ncbi:MAG: carbohydrate kinase family protein [Tannerella sp.]|jgi:sugar/nucleoside kinase (ribokinase family)|nr:carbohydrate kinase family protein [Tannerella sp.]